MAGINFDLIAKEIAPRVQAGDLSLFLGAGFSIGAKSKNGLGIPSTPDLIERIFKAAGHTPAPQGAQLGDAFTFGKLSVKDFDGFLVDNFTCSGPEPWQIVPFKLWWKRIYTTNIDDIPQYAIDVLRKGGIKTPVYRIFNYLERKPIEVNFIEPPIVTLHGSVRDVVHGFVFDGVKYGEHSALAPDWLQDTASAIVFGDCVLVGSSFQESDINHAIQQRKKWDIGVGSSKNWVVLRKFEAWQLPVWEARGFVPIEAEAHEFFGELSKHVKLLTPFELLKLKHPYVPSAKNNAAIGWFFENFIEAFAEKTRAQMDTGVLPNLLRGDEPSWYYLVNGTIIRRDLNKKLLEFSQEFFEEQKYRAGCIAITGATASGKTAALLTFVNDLLSKELNIYQFEGINGIDIEKMWEVVSGMTGKVVFVFRNASEHYHGINAIADRINNSANLLKALFIIEDRTSLYESQSHHLAHFGKTLRESGLDGVSSAEANSFAQLFRKFGIPNAQAAALSDSKLSQLITDKEKGYRGDLLATLYDIYSGERLEKKLKEEYAEVADEFSKKIYDAALIVTAAEVPIPIGTLGAALRTDPSLILGKLRTTLKSKVHLIVVGHSRTIHVVGRHRAIAEFHLINSLKFGEKHELLMDLVKQASGKFEIRDIPKRPFAYRLYKNLLSHSFLQEYMFRGEETYVHKVYEEAQQYFGEDAMFWGQYGAFLSDVGQYKNAVASIRHGLDMYDSMHLRNSLGNALLLQFIATKGSDSAVCQEAFELLRYEIDRNIQQDPISALTVIDRVCDMQKARIPITPEIRAEVVHAARALMKYYARNAQVERCIGKATMLGILNVH